MELERVEGKIFYAGEFIDATIEIEDGIVRNITKKITGKKLKGIILPSAIDVHVHFRDFKEKDKETIKTGSLAALHGGVCFVIDQPNTNPVVESYNTYANRIEIAEKNSFVDYALNLALTKNNFQDVNFEIKKIEKKLNVKVPAVGEVFLAHENENLQVEVKCLKFVKKRMVTVHAEDPNFILFEKKVPNFSLRPPLAEISAIRSCMSLGNVYFCHVTLRESIKLIKTQNRLCEVTPHHLLFSVENPPDHPNVNPPLRKSAEKIYFKDLKLADVLASDHAPHLLEDKKNGASGFPGVETTYPIFVYLASKGILSFSELIRLFCSNPAKIFKLRRYGEIKIGNYANFSVFNTSKVESIKPDKLHSKCGWTPYSGFNAIFPDKVIIRGMLALDEKNILVDQGFGKILSVSKQFL